MHTRTAFVLLICGIETKIRSPPASMAIRSPIRRESTSRAIRFPFARFAGRGSAGVLRDSAPSSGAPSAVVLRGVS